MFCIMYSIFMRLYLVLGFVIGVLVLSKIFSPNTPSINSSVEALTTTVASKAEFISALAVAQPGDIIRISGTIEGGIVITKSGTRDAMIRIVGGTIKGGSTGRLVEIRDSQWLRFDNVTFDATGADSAVYILNSDDNGFVGITLKNAGGECFRIKAGSQNNTLLSSRIESCGRTKWNPPTEKTAEGVYIGTAPEQIAFNVNEATKSTATDKSGYFANPDNSNQNLINNNTIIPAYPENTKGNECVDIKEGAQYNMIIDNICSGQLDKNSGGMESRGEYNIFIHNTFNATICGAGIRLGGDDKQTQGVGNFIIENIFNDYSNINPICPVSASSVSDKTALHGAIKMEAPNQDYMCGNTVKDTLIATGTYKSQVNTTEFTSACDQNRVTVILRSKQFGVHAPVSSTPTITPTSPPSVPCPLKAEGDADCKKDSLNLDIGLPDFNIWLGEKFGGCNPTNLTGCGPDEDGDGNPMDTNFNFTNSGNLPVEPNPIIDSIDFNIWLRGYFAHKNPTLTPTTPPTGCTYPAQKLDLTNWKITLPTGSSGSPTEIKQPQLATFSIDPWFMTVPSCVGVLFRAPTSGVTTSGSSYPRSELREMTNNGQTLAAWTNATGTHTMIIDQAIRTVPQGKRHVVAGQIHDGNDDVTVIRLEVPANGLGSLYVTDGNNTHAKLIKNNYGFDERFQVKFVASPGKIEIYHKDNTATAFTLVHTLNKTISGSFFKAGAYTQSNCSTESAAGATCGESNYGEVIIYGLSVTHQ